MPPHRAHHAEGDMTSAFRSDLLEKRKNRMADRIGASVTNRFMKRGLILPGCTCVGKQEEIEERDNTRLSNSPRSTLLIFLSFFFFSHTLPSVLHWFVPRRAKMGRDDTRRGELVGWWVASPSPSCSNLVLLTFILISPHLLPSSSSFFLYLQLLRFPTLSIVSSASRLSSFTPRPREMRSISKRCGERWRGRGECQGPRRGLVHPNMLQYFSISCSIFNCLSFFWVFSSLSDSVLIL